MPALIRFRTTGHDRAITPVAHAADPVIHDQSAGQTDINAEFRRNFYDMITAFNHGW